MTRPNSIIILYLDLQYAVATKNMYTSILPLSSGSNVHWLLSYIFHDFVQVVTKWYSRLFIASPTYGVMFGDV